MRKTIFILCLILVASSCGKAITKMGIRFHNSSTLVSRYTNGDKELLFFPMIHLNKPEVYKKIKSKVDSLRLEGYAIYYEGIDFKKQLDSLEKDKMYRKLKSVIGIIPFDYYDKRNKQDKSLSIKGYVIQSTDNIGINVKTDLRADLGLDSLIYLYEKEKGEIKLSECQLKMKLLEKYKCAKVDKNNSSFLVLTLRNRYLSYLATHSKDKKILVLYGALHGVNFEKFLQQQDAAWKQVPTTKENIIRL
jgi:hypothetical protein